MKFEGLPLIQEQTDNEIADTPNLSSFYIVIPLSYDWKLIKPETVESYLRIKLQNKFKPARNKNKNENFNLHL